MTKYDQIWPNNTKIWQTLLPILTTTYDHFLRSEMLPLPPFGIFPKIHPFWRIQASFTTQCKCTNRSLYDQQYCAGISLSVGGGDIKCMFEIILGRSRITWVVKPPGATLTLYPVDRISTFAGKSFGANTKISGMVKRFPQYWAGWGMMQSWGQLVPARTRHVFNISQENLTYTCLYSGHSNRTYEKGKDRLMIDTILNVYYTFFI